MYSIVTGFPTSVLDSTGQKSHERFAKSTAVCSLLAKSYRFQVQVGDLVASRLACLAKAEAAAAAQVHSTDTLVLSLEETS